MTPFDFVLYALAFFGIGLAVGMAWMATYAFRRINEITAQIADANLGQEESSCR